MKIYVFGANGMLGTYVTKYLSQNFEVDPITRKDFDILDRTQQLTSLFFKKNIHEGDVVINCAGLIKQRDPSAQDMIEVNSLFPLKLAAMCEKKNVQLIHITTDCVFSGSQGEYTESSAHDCVDEYGKTKSLGEPKNACVIRTSIIGEEKDNKLSLIEWVKTNVGSIINGYMNHKWNGVTCLQLAKVIEQMIVEESYWVGVRHIYSNTVSKYELVSIINKVYGLKNIINPVTTGNNCFRDLSSNYEYVFSIPNLDIQIIELKEFGV